MSDAFYSQEARQPLATGEHERRTTEMTNIKGMRIYLCYTGAELCRVLPFNHGQPKEGFYTLLGQVTDEIQQGIWFRLEKNVG